uniref:Uncharacterized protein n=1 Tax=Amphimedon queenslandica TaxID=400682 RepID=A0A1X7VFM1_AMPQE
MKSMVKRFATKTDKAKGYVPVNTKKSTPLGQEMPHGVGLQVELVEVQKQISVYTVLTALAFGGNPATTRFTLAAMRPHLIKCIKDNKMTMFP